MCSMQRAGCMLQHADCRLQTSPVVSYMTSFPLSLFPSSLWYDKMVGGKVPSVLMYSLQGEITLARKADDASKAAYHRLTRHNCHSCHSRALDDYVLSMLIGCIARGRGMRGSRGKKKEEKEGKEEKSKIG